MKMRTGNCKITYGKSHTDMDGKDIIVTENTEIFINKSPSIIHLHNKEISKLGRHLQYNKEVLHIKGENNPSHYTSLCMQVPLL